MLDFYRIVFDLAHESEKVTYVRATDEDHAREKLFSRFVEHGALPVIHKVEPAEGEFITD